MVDAFEQSCVPPNRCATAANESLTFTLPKEVSPCAESDPEEAKAAIYAAAQKSLDAIYGDKRYTAGAAIHTRNENGEIHYHAHVLVGKFAEDRATAKLWSLKSRGGGNTGHRQLAQLKTAWKEDWTENSASGRPQDRIADRPNAAPALVIADGTRLEPLSRASRRQLEKDVAPWYAIPDKFGALVQRQLRLGAMDDRIFEVASGGRGADGWDREAFRRLFPEQERFLRRYDKRVETLRAIGYVTSEGHLAPEFRMHFAVRHGINPPELQRLRLDVANQAARRARHDHGTRQVPLGSRRPA